MVLVPRLWPQRFLFALTLSFPSRLSAAASASATDACEVPKTAMASVLAVSLRDMTSTAPAGWFPDPFARFEHRYWDGFQWTQHVGASGQQSIDPPVVASPPEVPMIAKGDEGDDRSVLSAPADLKVQRQVQKLGLEGRVGSGGGTLLTERLLVVNQKAKLFERRAEYGVYDQYGHKVGGVREFGTSMSRMVVGRENGTKRLQIVDENGQPMFTLTRPATMLKSKVVVMAEDGSHVGQIVQENFGMMASVLGGKFNIRFRMESEGVTLGTINAESWQAWDFSIQDNHGSELGRITKTWAGFTKQNWTKADNYVLELHRSIEGPLLALVVCAALAVDTVLHQDSNRR
jgi:hypothetical protein